MKQIYVVICSEGMYSDRVERLVAAFSTEKEAAQRVIDATRKFKEYDAERKQPRLNRYVQQYLYKNEFDLDGYGDSSTSYRFEKIELIESEK